MFGSQRERLLRTKWADAYMLALELYAMMGDLSANGTDQPLAINPPNGLPALKLGNYKSGDSLITVTGRNGEPVGTISISGGSLVFTPAGGAAQQAQPATAPASSSFAGQVQSGSGTSYTVKTYTKGRTLPGTNLTVAQLQIDPGQTIPPGTWVIVIQEPDGNFCMQVPVWL